MTNYWYPKLGGSGGGGTVGPGTSPQHAYFSDATTVLSDSNMQKGAQGTELLAISYLLNQGTTAEYYVSKTGNDSNAGTIGAPFLTIARGLSQFAANVRGGNCVLNVGAGTYTEQLTAPVFMGNSDLGFGPSVLKIVGSDVEDPTATVIKFDSDIIFRAYDTPTIMYFDGIQFESATPFAEVAIDVRNASVVLENVNFLNADVAFNCGAGGFVYWAPNEDGGIISSRIDCIKVNAGRFICAANLNLTGNRDSAFSAKNNGVVELTSDVTNITSGGVSCKNHFYFESGAILKTGNTVTFDLSDADTGFDSVAFRVDSGMIDMGGACIVNITDCSQAGYFTGNSIWKNGANCEFYYFGTTNNNWFIADSSIAFNEDNFTTGVINSTNTPGANFAYDFRYVTTYSGSALGAVPSFSTRYVSTNGLSTTYIPLYIAGGNEIVDQLEIRTLTSAGTGLTDTYTLQLNGADTLMVVSMANTNSNVNNSDKINLVSGNSVGIKVFTDLASATTNVFAQFTVRKLPN